ncbi:type II toxin-antitoxin system HicA family toxin [Nostoc sp. CHAB 5824]|nr:type II toxin-antitoxin system HicA family toxin [Nostoc sp. CHAB 5824]
MKANGWYLDRTKGSDRQFKHPDKPGLVTVTGKLSGNLYHFTLINDTNTLVGAWQCHAPTKNL